MADLDSLFEAFANAGREDEQLLEYLESTYERRRDATAYALGFSGEFPVEHGAGDFQVVGATTGALVGGAKPKSNSSKLTAEGEANLVLGERLAAEVGWVGNEWLALKDLWTKESGWRNTAQNPTSTAYGIAQFLNSTWKGTGYTKSSDPVIQIKAGIIYIRNRYRTPSRALAFWLSKKPHWY